MKTYKCNININDRATIIKVQTDGVYIQCFYYMPHISKNMYKDMLDFFDKKTQNAVKEMMTKTQPDYCNMPEMRSMFTSREPFWACDR